MSFRNVTRAYIEIRNSHKANRGLRVFNEKDEDSDSDEAGLLGSYERNNNNNTNDNCRNSIELSSSSARTIIGTDKKAIKYKNLIENTLPPQWVDIVEEVEDNVRNIRMYMRQLSQLHAKRLMINFERDETEEEYRISSLTKDITNIFKRTESLLRQFNLQGDEHVITPSERKVRSNLQKSIAKRLQGLSGAFRQSQKEYLARISAQKTGENIQGLDFLSTNGSKNSSNSDYMNESNDFTSVQLMELEDTEALVHERDEEITRIAQSIEELATIFKELAVLVIDQGTVLDRIDFNMEQVVEHTRQGIDQLVVADTHSKSNRPLKCVLILIVLIMIFAIILFYKWKRKLGFK